MKRLASLSFILVAGVLAACMPPVEEVAATYFAQETIEAATATPLPPTDTPLAHRHPSADWHAITAD